MLRDGVHFELRSFSDADPEDQQIFDAIAIDVEGELTSVNNVLVGEGDVTKAVGSSVGGLIPVSAADDIEKSVAVQEEARLGLGESD